MNLKQKNLAYCLMNDCIFSQLVNFLCHTMSMVFFVSRLDIFAEASSLLDVFSCFGSRDKLFLNHLG